MQYPQLALTGLLAFFGSLNAAVPFLLDVFRIPADTFQLFIATGVINSRFGALVAAVHTIVVALLGSAAIAGTMRFDSRRIIRAPGYHGRAHRGDRGRASRDVSHLASSRAQGRRGGTADNLLADEPARIVAPPAAAEGQAVTLAGVQARGTVRVGFVQPRMPFVFRNARQELVGFDVELVKLLTRELGVQPEFVEWQPGELLDAVAMGRSDIDRRLPAGLDAGDARDLLSALPRRDRGIRRQDHLRSRFETWASIQEATDLSIGIPPMLLLRAVAPGAAPWPADPRVLGQPDPLADSAGFDAVAMPAERGSVLTLLNPKWTVVVPSPGLIKIPLAFPLGGTDPQWSSFVNTWIEMKRRDGTLDALYDHWILGKDAEKRMPRWSVVRNVLHWGR